jgi:hypothetical protein
MRRARSCRWWSTALAAGLWLTLTAPLEAASFVLMPHEREEALRAGHRSVATEDWDREWRVDGGQGQRLSVLTPFHRLAAAARNSAFRKKELTPRQVQSLLKEQQNKLVLWTTLRGGQPDFARFYSPTLLAGAGERKASFTQNERTARREEDGRYTARCLYVFPAEGLDPRGTVTLLVRDLEEKLVAKFTVDLAAMR